MPALPSPGKVVRCTLHYTGSEDLDIVNRFFLSYSGAGPTAVDMETWLGTVFTAWGSHMAPETNNDFSLVDVTGTDLASSTGVELTATSSVPGTESSASMPASVCAVLRLHIGRRYRGGHPRLYLPPEGVNALQDQQTWKVAYQTALAAAWEGFINEISTSPPTSFGTLEQVNVSYYSGFTNHTYPSGRVRPVPNVRATPLVDVITAVSVNPKVGSQRRRNLQAA